MILCENPSDHIRAKVRLTSLKKNGAVNLSLDAQAKEDKVSTTLNWGNNATATYSGKLAGKVLAYRRREAFIKSNGRGETDGYYSE